MDRKLKFGLLFVFVWGIFSTIPLSARQTTEQSTDSAPKNHTSGVVAAVSLPINGNDEPTRLLSIGKIFKSGLGIEANILADSHTHVVVSGNILWYPIRSSRIHVFGTAGLGGCNCEDSYPFVNYGGGVILRMTDHWNVRTEYRHYGTFDGNWTYILAGISYLRTQGSVSMRKFHVLIGQISQKTSVQEDMGDVFKASGLTTENHWNDSDHPHFYHDLAVEYSLSERFQFGIAWITTDFEKYTYTSSDEDIEGGRKSWYTSVLEEAQAAHYSLLLNYTMPRFGSEFLSRFEGAIGAGLLYSDMAVKNHFSTSTFTYFYGEDAEASEDMRDADFSVVKKAVGLHIQGSIDFYVTEGISLQFKAAQRFLPGLDVPEYRYFDLIDNTEKTLKSHSINFSSLGISIGARFHL